MLIFNYGSTYFLNKVVLTKYINVCRMIWDLIWGTSCFYKSNTEEAKRGGKSVIQPILCCQLSMTMVSTTPSSMEWTEFSSDNPALKDTRLLWDGWTSQIHGFVFQPPFTANFTRIFWGFYITQCGFKMNRFFWIQIPCNPKPC